MVATVQSFGKQRVRIAKETTYGVAPAAIDKQLNDISIVPKLEFDSETFTPAGDSAPSLNELKDSFTSASVSGKQSFTGLGFVLSSLFGVPTTTTPTGGTLAKQHKWIWDGRSLLAPVSYAIDYGTAARAYRILGAVFNGLTLGIKRGGLDFGSSLWAAKPPLRGIGAGSTPPYAATPTDIPALPVFGLQYDAWLDDTWAALGMTGMLALYEASLAITERTDRTQPVKSDRSADGVIEKPGQKHTSSLTVGVDAVLDALLGTLEQGAKKFARYKATGPLIEATVPYSLQVDHCLLLTGANDFSGFGSGVHAMQLDGELGRDDVSGKVLEVTLVNKQAGY